ncbi:hypothetical protein ACMHYB_36400 [Sorangium sp. So ce1128]
MNPDRTGSKGMDPTQIPPEAILAESDLLRAMLAGFGVPARARDDVLQECLMGAIVAVRVAA